MRKLSIIVLLAITAFPAITATDPSLRASGMEKVIHNRVLQAPRISREHLQRYLEQGRPGPAKPYAHTVA